jgi:hypothetical protein
VKEVWVKKTIWRRYLVGDENIKAVKQILQSNKNGDELVADCYDTNKSVEYDNEIAILPIEFEVKGL